MSTLLNVLLVDDREAEAALLIQALQGAGFAPRWRRVETEAEFLANLTGDLDVILASDSAASLDAPLAISLLHARGLDVPIIVVAGELGETAVSLLKQGAADCLPRNQLSRLGASVRQAIDQHQLRRRQQQAEAALRADNRRLMAMFQNAQDAIFLIDDDAQFVDANPAACQLTGYSQQQLRQLTIWAVTQVTNLARSQRRWEQFLAAGQARGDYRIRRQDGAVIPAEYRAVANIVPGVHLAILRDASDRERAIQAEREQRALAEALRDTAATLNTSLELPEIFDKILDNVGRVVPHDGANISLIEDGTSYIVGCRGYYETLGIVDDLLSYRLRVDEAASLQQMMRTRRPVIVDDTASDPAWIGLPAIAWVRSYIGAPIVRGDQVIGFLSLDARTPGFFQPAHGERLQAFAGQVAIAIRNAELYKEVRRRLAIEETLRRASAALNATLSLNEVLHRILEQLGMVIPFDSAAVMQRDDDMLAIRAVKGFHDPNQLIGLRMPISLDRLTYQAITTQTPVAVADIAAASPEFPAVGAVEELLGIRSWLGIPLVKDGQTLGLITLDRRQVQPYSEQEIDLASAFANHATIAIQNARLYEALERHSASLAQAVADRTAELVQAKEQAETILNNSPDAIILLTSNGTVAAVNAAFEELFGYWSSAVNGRSPGQFVIPEQTEKLERVLAAVIRSGRRHRLELQGQTRDGRQFDCDIALAPVTENGAVSSVVCSLRDISAFKEVERLKDSFVANVSHELRTPITSLKLNHKLLTLNPAKQELYIQRLEREIDRLNYIVEDLLRLSRLDQGRVKLNRRPLDLNLLARQYATDRRPLAEDLGLSLTLECTAEIPLVDADEGLIGQALSVLLTNALNYTPRGGAVRLSTLTQLRDGLPWSGLRVADNGPGIGPEEMPHLFERFYRGEAGRESGAAGTGLGLPIAQEIVSRHHGSIEVASEGIPGQGTTFTLWLPSIGQKAGSETKLRDLRLP